MEKCPQLKTAVEAFQAAKSAYIKVFTDDLWDDDGEGPEFILDFESARCIVNDKHLLKKISMMKIAVETSVWRAKATICWSVDLRNLYHTNVLYLRSYD